MEGGYYFESTWEIKGDVNVIVNGEEGNEKTRLIVGTEIYEGFIICKEGMKGWLFMF